MFNMREEIDNGKDKDTIEKHLGELLAEEYIYPVAKLSK